jgi:hypothetical protein
MNGLVEGVICVVLIGGCVTSLWREVKEKRAQRVPPPAPGGAEEAPEAEPAPSEEPASVLDATEARDELEPAEVPEPEEEPEEESEEPEESEEGDEPAEVATAPEDIEPGDLDPRRVLH